MNLHDGTPRRVSRFLAIMTAFLMGSMGLGLFQPAHATVTPGQGNASFNSYMAKPPTYSGLVTAVAVTPDGAVLAGGSFSNRLIMFNSDGTTTGTAAAFNSNISGVLSGTGSYSVTSIAVLGSGQIVVGGSFTGRLKMFNPDGTTDGVAATFNANVPLLNGDVEGILRLADGSLVLGGSFTDMVKMLNADGSSSSTPASTFNTNVSGVLSGGYHVRPMAVASNGSIIVGGDFTNKLKKLNSNGTTTGVAETFNNNVGSTIPHALQAMTLDESHGALTIGGAETVQRLNLDGTTTGTAATFNTAVSGLFTGTTAWSMVANSDGAIVVAGDNIPVRMLNLNGSRTGAAATFDANSPYTSRVYSMASMADGSLVLGGGILAGVGRLAPDGSSTTGASGTFNLNADGLVNGSVYSSATFRGGLLVGGSLTGALRMINEDGSTTGTAATFNANVGDVLDDGVRAIEVLASGGVVVGGYFTGKVKMFNADGTTSGVAAAFNTNVAAAMEVTL